MTAPKQPRNTKQLTPTAAADKLAPLLSNLAARIETARDEAEMTERQRTAEQWRKIIVRVEESERPRILKVLEALGVDCCGLTLEIANETSRPATAQDEGDTELPPGARPMEPAREERIGRLTGAKR